MDGVAGVTQDAVPVGRHVHLPVRRRPGRDLLVPLAPGLARAGQRRAVRRAGVTPRAPARRDADRRARGRCTSTTGSRPSTARPATSGRGRRGRRTRSGCGSSTPTTGPSVWTSGSPYRVLAVDGYDLHEPDAGDRPVGAAHRRRPGRPGGDRAGRRVDAAGRVERHSVIGPGAPAPSPQPTATGGPADLRHARAAAASTRPRPTGGSATPSGAGPASSTAGPACGGRSTATSTPTCRCSWSTRATSCTMHIENHSGEVHPMHLHGHHAVVLARNGVPATGSPWWIDSLDVANGDDLRHRVRRRQPRHLDGPLPQPAARRAGPGRAPDVRRRHRPRTASAGRPDNQPE